MTVDEKYTVNGVPVKVGDKVWSAHRYSGVRLTTMTNVHLGYWWYRVKKEIYSTESLAIRAAIEAETEDLRKAKQEVTRATKAVARLHNRLEALS